MKLTQKKLRKIILEELERLSFASKEQGYTYGLEHISDDLNDEAADDLIGHTWLTHVRKKDSSLNEVGEVLWHSLDNDGNIKVYDVEWPDGTINMNVPASLLEGVKMQEHEHESNEEDEPVNEKRKKKKKKKSKKRKSNKWYYGSGFHYHHDNDWYDFGGFDGGFGGAGDGGGGGGE